MKYMLFVCGLVLFQSLAYTAEISVGGTELSIPAPSGYSQITSDMKPYSEFALRFVPASNEQFALFLPEADVALAAKGGIPASERRFYVQTTKDLVKPFISTAEFAELKRLIKTQNDELVKKAEKDMPGFFDKMNKGISKDYMVDLNLSVNQIIPFPPHYETPRAMAYSMLVKYNMNDANGTPSVVEAAITTTFIYVQGKVLFLYSAVEKSGLEWSRAESLKWADMVIEANPSVGAVAAREASSSRSGFNWGRVATGTITGAVIGAIVGAIGYVFKRNRG